MQLATFWTDLCLKKVNFREDVEFVLVSCLRKATNEHILVSDSRQNLPESTKQRNIYAYDCYIEIAKLTKQWPK